MPTVGINKCLLYPFEQLIVIINGAAKKIKTTNWVWLRLMYVWNIVG